VKIVERSPCEFGHTRSKLSTLTARKSDRSPWAILRLAVTFRATTLISPKFLHRQDPALLP
jgi:hypothetical protein